MGFFEDTPLGLELGRLSSEAFDFPLTPSGLFLHQMFFPKAN